MNAANNANTTWTEALEFSFDNLPLAIYESQLDRSGFWKRRILHSSKVLKEFSNLYWKWIPKQTGSKFPGKPFPDSPVLTCCLNIPTCLYTFFSQTQHSCLLCQQNQHSASTRRKRRHHEMCYWMGLAWQEPHVKQSSDTIAHRNNIHHLSFWMEKQTDSIKDMAM